MSPPTHQNTEKHPPQTQSPAFGRPLARAISTRYKPIFIHCIHSVHDQPPHIHHMNMDAPSPTPPTPLRSVPPPSPAPLFGLIDRPAPSWFSSRCRLGVRSSLCSHADINGQEKALHKQNTTAARHQQIQKWKSVSFLFHSSRVPCQSPGKSPPHALPSTTSWALSRPARRDTCIVQEILEGPWRMGSGMV